MFQSIICLSFELIDLYFTSSQTITISLWSNNNGYFSKIFHKVKEPSCDNNKVRSIIDRSLLEG